MIVVFYAYLVDMLNYNNNLSNTTKTLENILTLIKNTLVEYQKKMEIKYNKKNLIMTIIRKVYQRYYDDFKLSNANNSLILLKFLSVLIILGFI